MVATKIMLDWPAHNPEIVTFTKGGTFASAFVSKYLSWKPTILSLGEASFVDGKRRRASILLDDILDTGTTVSAQKARHSYFLFDKPGAHRVWTPRTYFAAEVIPAEEWCVFPWE